MQTKGISIWDNYPQEIVENINDIKLINTKLPCIQKLQDDLFIEKLSTSIHLNEIYYLLKDHYTNQKHSINVYSKNLLMWFFNIDKNPVLIGIREKNTNQLIGFICGITRNVQFLEKKILDVIEVNFLCIHKNYRQKYLVEILINQLWSYKGHSHPGIFYTAKQLPLSFTFMDFLAYPINIEKLINADYFELPQANRNQYVLKLYNFYKPTNKSNILRRVNDSDIKYIIENLNIFYKNKIYFEIDENMLYGMLSNPDFYMFCSDDLQNFVSLYITTDINHNNEIKVGNVYLFYQSNSLISYTIQKLTNICDILVFPCIFCNNIKGSIQYYKYNFHLFQHSSIQIDYNNNFLQIF